MSTWLEGNFSKDHVESEFAAGRSVGIMVLSYCFCCQQLLPNYPQSVQYDKSDYDRDMKNGAIKVVRGNVAKVMTTETCDTCLAEISS